MMTVLPLVVVGGRKTRRRVGGSLAAAVVGVCGTCRKPEGWPPVRIVRRGKRVRKGVLGLDSVGEGVSLGGEGVVGWVDVRISRYWVAVQWRKESSSTVL
jgi:hypothetical protein